MDIKYEALRVVSVRDEHLSALIADEEEMLELIVEVAARHPFTYIPIGWILGKPMAMAMASKRVGDCIYGLPLLRFSDEPIGFRMICEYREECDG